MAEAGIALGRERYARPLFIATIVTGSFLLFLTQPMIARMALPRLGGAPAVWNSAMLVFQSLLLAGYAYAHWLTRLAPRRQAGTHLAIFAVAALWLPIGLTAVVPPPDANPALWVPWFLLASIGPLFFVISAQAPLMQRWYALETSRGNPYALYAASNLGSFTGLIAYPLVAEPLLGLQQQSLLWTALYALLVLLVALCALTIPRSSAEAAPIAATPKPRPKEVLLWIALAAVPSGLMLSTTTHLTTDIIAMPLLWALPLGLYLLSFVVAFATRRGAADFITQVAPLIILIAGGLTFAEGSRTPIFLGTMGLSLLFVVAVALHSEMYRRRPGVDHLTGFYLAMSFGGMLGGLFCSIIAPAVFDWAYEHPLLIFAAAFLVAQEPLFARLKRLWDDHPTGTILAILIPVAAFLLSLIADQRIPFRVSDTVSIASSILISALAIVCIGNRIPYALCVGALMMSYGGWTTLHYSFLDARTRSYFGIYEVYTRDAGTVMTLTHGTTLHGVQKLAPGEEREPTTYYGPGSGVGRAMLAAEEMFGGAARIGVVGLGTGTLACYAKPGQSWRFYEIDPVVVGIARDPQRFSFLSRCTPDAAIEIGDARLTIAADPAGSLDILAVDAFSSDAVPMHMLTREALGVYGRAVGPDGLLMIHISNRYLDLKPVLAANARLEGWSAAMLSYSPDAEETADQQTASVWVALSRNPVTLQKLIAASGEEYYLWEEVPAREGFGGWSDDHASILPLLKNLLP